jgi:phosphatidylserine/phosphatidylglycerophosphate/cardiolipin synthase-like enzyme
VLAASAAPTLDRVERPPVDGATFNDPSAPPGPDRTRIIRSVTRMIDSAPRGATLRLTQYNLTCQSTIDALMRAIRRGVNVQIVVNDRVLGESVVGRPLYQRFGRMLGKNHKRDSFFIICERGCRTARGGALHTKFLSIDRIKTDSGQVVRHVLLTASGNLTCGWAVDRQYNDQFAIIGKPQLSRSFNRIFAQLAADRRPAKPFQTIEKGRYKAWFFPNPGGDRSEDPIWHSRRDTLHGGREVGTRRSHRRPRHHVHLERSAGPQPRAQAVPARPGRLPRRGARRCTGVAGAAGGPPPGCQRGRCRVGHPKGPQPRR